MGCSEGNAMRAHSNPLMKGSPVMNSKVKPTVIYCCMSGTKECQRPNLCKQHQCEQCFTLVMECEWDTNWGICDECFYEDLNICPKKGSVAQKEKFRVVSE